MTISEKIFEIIEKQGMSQKEFSVRTGIAQSAISDWKRKKTNPVSNKILTICNVLNITPNELLSGTDDEGTRSKKVDFYVIDKHTDLGLMIQQIQKLDSADRGRIQGYLDALNRNSSE